MIEILFSPEFDSGLWTGAKPIEWGSIGKVSLGVIGLLDLLETHLGLKQPDSISYQRKIEYLRALQTDNHRSKDFIVNH